MEKIKIVKTVVNFIVGIGTGQIVRSIIQNNTNPEKVTEKVTIAAGSIVLGSMAADASKTYTDAKIDGWHESWEATKKTNTNQA